MEIKKSFKTKNPYRADQEIRQEVSISEEIMYDYSKTPWISVDTEYLSFNPLQDKLCVIQICSKESVDSQDLRVEIIYVFEKEATQKLKDLMTDEKIEKLFHVYSSDIPRIEEFIGARMQGKIFDTKVAAKIAWTNTREYGMKALVKMFSDPNFEQSDNEKGLNDWEIGPDNWTNAQVYYMMQDVIYLDVLRMRILDMAERRGSKELVEETMTILPQVSQLFKMGYSEKVLVY